MQLGDVRLSSRACVDRWEEKAGLYSEYIDPDCTPVYTSSEVIDPSAIVDITRYFDEDGILRWDVPDGTWGRVAILACPDGEQDQTWTPQPHGIGVR